MCPNCSNAFSPKRIDSNHISPRFDACQSWSAFINDEPVSGVFEVYAGKQGWLWGMEDSPCSCGSGYKSMVYIAAKVELYHPEHERTIIFDDLSSIKIICPRQHLGPYDRIKEETSLEELIKQLHSVKGQIHGEESNTNSLQ